jgi:LPPG:FO 2-phospho-L-lactate transferase
MLAALLEVVPAERVTAVANVGDDLVLHGLHISPDLDTITYTLAGQINPDDRMGAGRRVVAGDGDPRALWRASTGSTWATGTSAPTSIAPIGWVRGPR